MRRFYAFFFVSGFCGLLYELVWLRLAIAQFGVTTTLVASFLSVFMAGLGLGSWLVGRLLRKHESELKFPRVYVYAVTELLIGLSALIVPLELAWGHSVLLLVGSQISSSSVTYYLLSGSWLFIALVPWCFCMGATFPAAMFALNSEHKQRPRSFSYLYLANVLGAMAGSVLPLLFIEKMGFSGTLKIGAVLNFIVFLTASVFAPSQNRSERPAPEELAVPNGFSSQPRSATARWLLFGTGLTSMAAEVVWVRMFTPFLGTVVYSFATILLVYLSTTFLGTSLYRKLSRGKRLIGPVIWILLGFSCLLPLAAADTALHMRKVIRILIGIGPLAFVAGFATPMLVDSDSGGDPERAGLSYAMNVLGCVVGPLVSGYFLLPLMSERLSLVVLALPWFVYGTFVAASGLASPAQSRPRRTLAYSGGLAILSVAVFMCTKGYEKRIHAPIVVRDYTATVIATGTGRSKHLLVNGIGMTGLTPITKMMAHLPLAFIPNPQKTLVICFGMGTTHRSMLSWGVDSTVVELVPSVPKLFYFYHPESPGLLQSPRSHVIVDDGRHYMEWSHDQYDVIAIDPPPPVEAAASSLLYSREFYAIARRHLRPGGILAQWFPGGDQPTQAAIARALRESFPYVRTFLSFEGWGVHFLASTQPLPSLSAADLASHMPPAARADLLEWGPKATVEQQYDAVLHNEFPIDLLIAKSPATPAIQDNLPINEYFLLRNTL